MKRIVLISLGAGVFASVMTLLVAGRLGLFSDQIVRVEHVESPIIRQTSFSGNSGGPSDFSSAAEIAMPAVVHIKATQTTRSQRSTYRHPLEEFFWPDMPAQPQKPSIKVGTGSGVILTEDGYIVTNNHVVEDADDLEVTMNDNRSFKATVAGVDPSTDLALLKIDGEGLPFMKFGHSDNVRVGQWVLAVGNPFNLTSTVTAGIISAKGRNINILRDKYAIESFLQTDAAINPGNSGGALVDLDGELIGINTAIASPTGSYSGYGFAVPSEIVRKVTDDLREFGVVQRGFIGVMIADVTAELMKEKDLAVSEGVYVSDLLEDGAASEAGIKKGDVIISVNGQDTKTSPELQEIVGRERPGDTIKVVVYRGEKQLFFNIELKNKSGDTEIVTKDRVDLLSDLGIEVADVERSELSRIGVSGGVKVTNILSGKIKKYTDMRPGFIITRIDKQEITSVEQLVGILKNKKGGVMIEGRYPDYSGVYYYAFGM